MTLCSINGLSVEPDELTFIQFAFGKEGATTFNYEITFFKDVFIEKLKPLYDAGIEELREDDQITGEFDPPYPGAMDYPSLTEFTAIEGPYLYEYLYAYHKFDILSLVLTEANDQAGYIINTLESIDRIDGSIVIRGAATKR